MDVLEAIRSRRTIRGYRPDPVPQATLAAILETAQWSPSWGNNQPWELIVVSGEPLEAIKRGLYERTDAGVAPNPDVPAPDFPEETRQRARGQGAALYASMGVSRDDPEARKQFGLRGSRLFGAPVGVFIVMDRRLGAWAMLDVGLAMQTIMLTARAHGLGTSALYQMVRYPDVLRAVLKVPESKQIVCGIAIGYPDADVPQNHYERPRLPLDTVASWVGFE